MALNRTDTRATRDILIHTLVIKGRRGHPFRPTTLFQIPHHGNFSPSPVWGGSPSLNSGEEGEKKTGDDAGLWTSWPRCDKCTDRVCTAAVNNPSPRGCNCGLDYSERSLADFCPRSSTVGWNVLCVMGGRISFFFLER